MNLFSSDTEKFTIIILLLCVLCRKWRMKYGGVFVLKYIHKHKNNEGLNKTSLRPAMIGESIQSTLEATTIEVPCMEFAIFSGLVLHGEHD